jgi:hypothetical protein
MIDFSSRIMIVFIDDYGNKESGIDENGLYKEFMVDLTTEIFNPKYGFFSTVNNNNDLHLNARSLFMVTDNHDQVFESLGIMLAKAITDQVFLNIRFNRLFLRYVFLESIYF